MNSPAATSSARARTSRRTQLNELLNRQEPTFREAEPSSEDMAAAQAADPREGALHVAVLKLEEDLRKLFWAARLRQC